MGMGEPLQNYAETMKFMRIIHDPDGLDLGARRITVSTSGIVPRIDALADETSAGQPRRLAARAERRDALATLVPINRRYPIAICSSRSTATSRRRDGGSPSNMP